VKRACSDYRQQVPSSERPGCCFGWEMKSIPRLRTEIAARSLSAGLHNSQLDSVQPLPMLLSLALGSIGSALKGGYLAAPRFPSCTLFPLICNESTGAHHYILSLRLHIVYRPGIFENSAVVPSCTLVPLICNESTGAHHYILSLRLHIVYRPGIPDVSGIFESSAVVSSCTLVPLICNNCTGAHHYILPLRLHIVYRPGIPDPRISGNLEIFEIVFCGWSSWSVVPGDL
jgi:hypothetical protein